MTAAVLMAAGSALAQTVTDPLTKSLLGTFARIEGNITKAAEQVPEADYAFKPTPAVRSFGELLGHVVDANYGICSAAAGEKVAGVNAEKTMTKKADLQKALTDAFAYCDKVFAGMTDAKGAEPVSFFGGQQPRLAVLAFNTSHDFEHYGNIVTYMRLKGLVPPSSQR